MNNTQIKSLTCICHSQNEKLDQYNLITCSKCQCSSHKSCYDIPYTTQQNGKFICLFCRQQLAIPFYNQLGIVMRLTTLPFGKPFRQDYQFQLNGSQINMLNNSKQHALIVYCTKIKIKMNQNFKNETCIYEWPLETDQLSLEMNHQKIYFTFHNVIVLNQTSLVGKATELFKVGVNTLTLITSASFNYFI